MHGCFGEKEITMVNFTPPTETDLEASPATKDLDLSRFCLSTEDLGMDGNFCLCRRSGNEEDKMKKKKEKKKKNMKKRR